MGWTFHHQADGKTADLITREFTQHPTDANPWAFGVESVHMRGNVAYCLMWQENTRDKIERRYFGEVVLTSRKNGGFGYKNMAEDMEPYYYDAPLVLINKLDELAPAPTTNAKNWRAQCRKHHAQKASRRRWAVGDYFQFRPSQPLYVVAAKALARGNFYCMLANGDGRRYLISTRQLNRCHHVTAAEAERAAMAEAITKKSGIRAANLAVSTTGD